MRIAIVSETWSPEVNGVALTVVKLADGLEKEGHEVQIIRPRQCSEAEVDPDCAETVLVRGSAIPRYPGLQFGWPAARRIAAAWKRWRPDAVYVATEGPLGLSALRVASRLNIPAASGFHTRFDVFTQHYGLGALESLVFAYLRYFHNLGAATLVPTKELQKTLAARGVRNVDLLERSVDTVLFSPEFRDPELRASWGVGDSELAVLYVGRIAPEKNIDLSVRAFRAIQQSQPGARYIFVGDGPARAALGKENPDFIFAGVQRGKDLARYFASADLFPFASLSETFGNVVLEALASGVPTVAFDYAAARDYVDSTCGEKVEVGNGEQFVRSAVKIANDRSHARNMRQSARGKVRKLESRSMASQFAALLARLGGTRSACSSTASGV